MICENDQLLAWAVPVLTDEDLAWMDKEDAEAAIVANYEDWEAARAAVNERHGKTSLATLLTRKAKGL